MGTVERVGQIALYEDSEHEVHLDVRVDGETVWLTQQQMAVLFGRDVTTIRKHIKGAREEELSGFPTSAKYALVREEGRRTVERQVEHYNLDVIISVGVSGEIPAGRTLQTKAANLLYLVVKDLPFLDGNKRSAAALFVHFLDRNGILREGERLRVEGNALAAMTLMIALSDPSEKESMVTLVENFIG